ncbi:hypothetical protein [Nitrospina watsonii]|uniref:HEPN domain-containing protein n=1 Tax=Nitrospina watsonii TaxID=1323948 RepID=A0ABM9HBE7_9BACT|nr:hypothetical protein [Nitrospina watsonii]CAI2717446.1 conserved protein of unknown function [Nitrospina watsonii]
MNKFRLKRLQRFQTGGSGGSMTLSFPTPKSPTGKVYQECPDSNCQPRLFQLGDYLTSFVPNEKKILEMYRPPGPGKTICPYCGGVDTDENFVAGEDISAIHKYIQWAAEQDMGDNLENMVRELNRSMPKNELFSIGFKLKRTRKLSPPITIREDLLRSLVCDACGHDYGVYAIALYCPDCGSVNVHLHFQREVELVRRQTELAEKFQEEGDIELGFRLMGNAHEDVVTAYETALKAIYCQIVRRRFIDQVELFDKAKAVGNSFQNIERGRKLFGKLGLDPYHNFSSEDLEILRLNLEKRHIIGHNLSLVDDRYSELANEGELGRTVSVRKEDIDYFVKLCAKAVESLSVELKL